MVAFSFNWGGRMVQLNVPLLTIVPIPYIAINTIDINFKASISASSSTASESSEHTEAGGEVNAKAKLNLGLFSLQANLKANYSSKKDSKATAESKYSVESTIDVAAMLLDCEPAALKAVKKVETGDKGGFLPSGRPTILFDGHIFWQQLRTRGITPQEFTSGNEDILYPKWTKAHYKGGEAEYERLLRARRINGDAANASASWGMFQIMGFNHAACGEQSVACFVNSMCQSECRQLLLSVRFIRGNKSMLAALQKKDWPTFARLYNVPAYAQNRYDDKLSKAYVSFCK